MLLNGVCVLKLLKYSFCQLLRRAPLLQHTDRDNIKTQMIEFNLMKRKDPGLILKMIAIEFPSKPMTLDEFSDYGEEQANKIKIQLNVSEEISEIIGSLFYSKWCDLVYEEYEKFIYRKFSDYINTFNVNFAYEDIKAITNHFNLVRVEELVSCIWYFRLKYLNALLFIYSNFHIFFLIHCFYCFFSFLYLISL